MRRRRGGSAVLALIALLVSGLFNGCAVAPSTATPTKTKEESQPKDVPPALGELLQKKFTQYRIPEEMMNAEWKRLATDGGPPYLSLADFNGDGLTDVALFLIQGRPPFRSYHWYIYLFLQDSSGRYSEDGIHRLDDFAHEGGSGRAIQHHALGVHGAGMPVFQGEKNLGYSYRTNSISLMGMENNKMAIQRIYALDPRRNAIHRTILDEHGPMDDSESSVTGFTSDGKDMVLPSALKQNLAAEFQGMRLPTGAERSRGLWRLMNCSNCVPWATTGDFNGDGSEDIALMLVDPDGGARLWKVVAFLQSDNHVFESFELSRFGQTIAGPNHAKAGQNLPPPAPTAFALGTISKGEKLPSTGENARLDTIQLSTIVTPEGVGVAKGGKLWTWMERYRSFVPESYGSMTD